MVIKVYNHVLDLNLCFRFELPKSQEGDGGGKCEDAQN